MPEGLDDLDPSYSSTPRQPGQGILGNGSHGIYGSGPGKKIQPHECLILN